MTIDIEPLPPVLTIDDALARRETIWGADDVFKSYAVAKGDVDAAFAGASVIVEGAYETRGAGTALHRPNGSARRGRPKRGTTVWGSMQCPYYIHHALAGLFELPRRIASASSRWRPAADSAARRSSHLPGVAGHAALPGVGGQAVR